VQCSAPPEHDPGRGAVAAVAEHAHAHPVVGRGAPGIDKVQCSAVQCSAVQCSAVQCITVQCSALQSLTRTSSSYDRTPPWRPTSPSSASGQRSPPHRAAVQGSAVQGSAVYYSAERGMAGQCTILTFCTVGTKTSLTQAASRPAGAPFTVACRVCCVIAHCSQPYGTQYSTDLGSVGELCRAVVPPDSDTFDGGDRLANLLGAVSVQCFKCFQCF
jgi:hypothetical protein